ncbi:MAG: nucleotidyltransferase domain-containing protein [Thermodesulfobacteriota bacterium]
MDDFLAILEELKRSLKRVFGDQILKMILFGSRARGDDEEESDIDVALIVRGLTPKLKDRILDEVADFEFKHDIPLSVLIFSEEEFDRLKKRERRIALDIEREGILL